MVERLRARGFDARQISQEHSYVPDLWLRFGEEPSILVYLEASLGTVRDRLGKSGFTPWMFREQEARLAHAREHADIVVRTDGLTPEEVADEVVRRITELSG